MPEDVTSEEDGAFTSDEDDAELIMLAGLDGKTFAATMLHDVNEELPGVAEDENGRIRFFDSKKAVVVGDKLREELCKKHGVASTPCTHEIIDTMKKEDVAEWMILMDQELGVSGSFDLIEKDAETAAEKAKSSKGGDTAAVSGDGKKKRKPGAKDAQKKEVAKKKVATAKKADGKSKKGTLSDEAQKGKDGNEEKQAENEKAEEKTATSLPEKVVAGAKGSKKPALGKQLKGGELNKALHLSAPKKPATPRKRKAATQSTLLPAPSPRLVQKSGDLATYAWKLTVASKKGAVQVDLEVTGTGGDDLQAAKRMALDI